MNMNMNMYMYIKYHNIIEIYLISTILIIYFIQSDMDIQIY
jgi:hypothetical protein